MFRRPLLQANRDAGHLEAHFRIGYRRISWASRVVKMEDRFLSKQMESWRKRSRRSNATKYA